MSQQKKVHIERVAEPYRDLHNYAYSYETYPFMLHGHEWATPEHLYQALKFSTVDSEFAGGFRTCGDWGPTAWSRGKLGPEPPADWADTKRDDAMRLAVLCKILAHDDLQELLLSTGDKQILYIVVDSHWGYIPTEPNSNMLGKILMEIRALLHQPGQAEAALMILIGRFREDLRLIK